MKRVILAIFVFTLLVLPSQVLAEDASYSFASAQGSSNLQAIPGATTEGVIYFYNVDGNRITHIVLEVLEAPEGWIVEVDPPLAEQEYTVGESPNESTITVTENLYSEPTAVYAEEITNVPDGMVSLTLPNKLGEDVSGYCLAKSVNIKVTIPESMEIGTTGDVKILATGSWLGQTGAAAIAQTRDFDFTVQAVLELTNEKPVVSGEGFDILKWLPWMIVGVMVIGVGFKLSIKKKGA